MIQPTLRLCVFALKEAGTTYVARASYLPDSAPRLMEPLAAIERKGAKTQGREEKPQGEYVGDLNRRTYVESSGHRTFKRLACAQGDVESSLQADWHLCRGHLEWRR